MPHTGDRYSEINDLTLFGFMANAMDAQGGRDDDRGQLVPRSDMEDMSRGTNFIPGKVTLDRRAGKYVTFTTHCSKNCWYWEFEDGSRHYHFDVFTYQRIARQNDPNWDPEGTVLAGPCPDCGNPKTNGGFLSAREVSSLRLFKA